MSLAEMLERIAKEQRESAAPEILPEAAIERLREHAARYAEMLTGPRFKVGDLVKPIADTPIKGVDGPHLVVETRRVEAPQFVGNAGMNTFGAYWDTRVLCMANGCVSPFWIESYQLEPWQESAVA